MRRAVRRSPPATEEKIADVASGADTVYPDRVLRQYRAVLEIDPEWPQILRDSGTDVVLLPSDALIMQMMLRQGWRVLYRDAQATLLLMPSRTT